MPHALPPWPVVDPQMRRWLDAGCFEVMVEDLRSLPTGNPNVRTSWVGHSIRSVETMNAKDR